MQLRVVHVRFEGTDLEGGMKCMLTEIAPKSFRPFHLT